MRTNLKEVAIKMETTPGTSAAPLASSDVLVRCLEEVTTAHDFERIPNEEVQATSSRRPDTFGRKQFEVPHAYRLRASGSLSVAPAIAPLLRMAMFREDAVMAVNIGAIAGGPFVDGETITGGTSGATATVFRDHADGVSDISFIEVAGTFDGAEEITGGTSGATATMSTSPTANGFRYKPADSDFAPADYIHHATVEYLLDGIMQRGRGCLADLNMVFRNGHPTIVRQTLRGALTAHGDQALYNPASFPEDAVDPPRLLDANLFFGAFKPANIVEATLAVPGVGELIEDANDASADGVLYADYDKAEGPTLSIEVKATDYATFDWLQKLQDGDTFALRWRLGDNTAGNTWDFFADLSQLTTISESSRNRLATNSLELKLAGTNNNELVIWAR